MNKKERIKKKRDIKTLKKVLKMFGITRTRKRHLNRVYKILGSNIINLSYNYYKEKALLNVQRTVVWMDTNFYKRYGYKNILLKIEEE